MQIRYTSKAKKAIDQASKMSKSLHHHYIGTEHILIGLLKEGTGVAAQVLNDNGVELDKVMQLIEELIAPDAQVLTAEAKEYSPRALQVLEGAAREAARFHAEEIGTEHILIAMMKETECVASRLLNTLAVNIQKMYVDILIAMGEDASLYKEDFMNGKPVKKTASDTPVLNQYSRDLTALAAEGVLDPLVGRQEEIGRVIQILSRRTKNNPCLIGEPGVGKTAIVEGIAERITTGMVPDTVAGKLPFQLLPDLERHGFGLLHLPEGGHHGKHHRDLPIGAGPVDGPQLGAEDLRPLQADPQGPEAHGRIGLFFYAKIVCCLICPNVQGADDHLSSAHALCCLAVGRKQLVLCGVRLLFQI